jgi:hypothetical protein
VGGGGGLNFSCDFQILGLDNVLAQKKRSAFLWFNVSSSFESTKRFLPSEAAAALIFAGFST